MAASHRTASAVVSGLRVPGRLDFGAARWIERAVEIDVFGVFGWIQRVIKVDLGLVFLGLGWRRIVIGRRFLRRHVEETSSRETSARARRDFCLRLDWRCLGQGIRLEITHDFGIHSAGRLNNAHLGDGHQASYTLCVRLCHRLHGWIEPTGSTSSPIVKKKVVHERLRLDMPARRHPSNRVRGRCKVPRGISSVANSATLPTAVQE